MSAPPATSGWLQELGSRVSWRRAVGFLVGSLVGKVLWNHYGILRHRRLPYHDLGLPILGHTLAIFRDSLEVWGTARLKGKSAVLAHYFFQPAVLVSYPLYAKFMHKAELDGEFVPLFHSSCHKLLGKNSILMLPGGKGHPHHKRLRSKILASIGPRQVLHMVPSLLGLIRQTLDDLAARSAADGYATFVDAAAALAVRAASIPITAGLEKETQARVERRVDEILAAFFALPVDFGRFSQFGRAMFARREVSSIIGELVARPTLDCQNQNLIANLARSSADGEAFTLEEVVDTVFTLLAAGQLTTADALPVLLAELDGHRDWADRVAREPLEFTSIEQDTATLRVVREALRVQPPSGAYGRVNHSAAIDLGEHGCIPRGCPFAVCFRTALQDMGSDFDPDRWTPEAVRDDFLVFGGSQPHACIGKSLALMELQLFARVLCREYDFKVLDAQKIVNKRKPVSPTFKDNLRVRISRKITA